MSDPGPDPFPRPAEEAERYGSARPHPARVPVQQRRSIWPWLVAGILASFLIGLLASPWLEAEVRGHLPAGIQPPEPAASAEVQALEARLAQLESRPPVPRAAAAPPSMEWANALEAAQSERLQADTDLSAQLQAVASDLRRVNEQARAGDERMRDMFLLGVARRMVLAGRPLTPVEELFARRFRGTDASAVDAMMEWSREPQTRRTLASRLPELGRVAAETEATAAGNWWERLKAGFSSMVTVRDPGGERAPDGEEAVKGAVSALRNDDLELAISELGSGPQTPATRQWIRDARLLLAAETALDRLDALALAAAIPVADTAVAPPGQAPVNAH